MRVRAETTYTREMLWKYARFYQLKNPVLVVLYCALILSGGGMVGYSLFIIIATGSAINLSSAFAFLALSLSALVLVILLLPYRTLHESKKMIGSLYRCELNELLVIITSDLSDAAGKITTNYEYFTSIYETKDVFYFFVSPRQAYFFKKSDIIEGSVDELRQLVKQNVPQNKFHSKLYL